MVAPYAVFANNILPDPDGDRGKVHPLQPPHPFSQAVLEADNSAAPPTGVQMFSSPRAELKTGETNKILVPEQFAAEINGYINKLQSLNDDEQIIEAQKMQIMSRLATAAALEIVGNAEEFAPMVAVQVPPQWQY